MLKQFRDLKTYDIPAALKTYEIERLTPTAKIILANRTNAPDRILHIVEERAPQEFKNIHDVIPLTEIEGMNRGYVAITGTDINKVNRRSKATEGKANPAMLNELLKSPIRFCIISCSSTVNSRR